MTLKEELKEIGRHHWRSFFKAKNPYQTFLDFIHGGFTCPKCGQEQCSYVSALCDNLCRSWRGSILVEKRLGCINCDFEEIIWRHPDYNKIMNMTKEEFQEWRKNKI